MTAVFRLMNDVRAEALRGRTGNLAGGHNCDRLEFAHCRDDSKYVFEHRLQELLPFARCEQRRQALLGRAKVFYRYDGPHRAFFTIDAAAAIHTLPTCIGLERTSLSSYW